MKYRKVLDGILYGLRTDVSSGKCFPKSMVSFTYHRRFQEWNRPNIFKKTWVRLLKIHENKIGNNWTWQSLDSISIKSPLGGDDRSNLNTDRRSKLG